MLKRSEANVSKIMNDSQIPTTSLFPAYVKDNIPPEATTQEWLTNTSFTTETLEVVQRQDETAKEKVSFSQPLPKVSQKTKKKEKKKSASKKKSTKESVVLSFRASSNFVVDRRRDTDNLLMDYSDPNQLPIWLSKLVVHVNEEKKPKSVEKMPRYFSRKILKKLLRNSDAEYFVPNTKCNISKLKGVIPLSSEVNKASSATDDNPKPRKSEKSILQLGNMLKLSENEIKKRTSEFNKGVTETPRDVNLWLKFVDFQEEIFRCQPIDNSSILSETPLVEKQVAILDKALKHNPNSIDLSVAKLKLLQKIRDTDELIKMWENLVFYHPNNVDVWKNYIEFIMTNILYFNVPRAVKLYEKCLQTLLNIHKGVIQSHRVPQNLVESMIDIFCSFCTFLRNSGYNERAIGTFQAFVEYSFFQPHFLRELDADTDAVTFFEPFWDSGVPRIGEKNAIGWSETVTKKKLTDVVFNAPTNLTHMEDGVLNLKLSKTETWLEFEKLRQSNHWLPWRQSPHEDSDDSSEELEDPERIITFDHVSPFLFPILEEKMRFGLLCKFLTFLGVDMHSLECNNLHKTPSDSSLFCESFAFLSGPMKDIVPKHFETSSCFHLLSRTCYTGLEEFTENVFCQIVNCFTDRYKNLVALAWLKYHVAMAKKSDSKKTNSIKKLAKAVLKRQENRNCLFLWSEYIELEWISGQFAKGSNMFESLLGSTKAASMEDTSKTNEMCYFSKNFVRLLTSDCKGDQPTIGAYKQIKEKVLWILVTVVERSEVSAFAKGKEYSPSAIIKTLTEFKKLIAGSMNNLRSFVLEETICMCLEPLAYSIINFAACSMYFVYFAQGVSNVIEHFNDLQMSLKDLITEKNSVQIRYVHEQLHMCKFEILDFHASQKQVMPISMESLLFEAIEMFPSNIQLMYFLLKVTKRKGSLYKTRMFLCNFLKSKQSVMPQTWFCIILLEIFISYHNAEILEDFIEIEQGHELKIECDMLQSFGNYHRVCNLIDEALTCRSLRNCVAVWRFCTRFHVLNGNLSKARTVFHEALRHCPWSKALFLDGTEYFPSDTEEFVKMMAEKQVHIRTLWEEVSLLMDHSTS